LPLDEGNNAELDQRSLLVSVLQAIGASAFKFLPLPVLKA